MLVSRVKRNLGSENGERDRLRKETNGKERKGIGNTTELELNNRVTGA